MTDAQAMLLAVALCGLAMSGAARAATLVGTPGPDRLVAPSGDAVNSLRGRAGDDVLIGGPGANTLAGGAGRDRLTAGAGKMSSSAAPATTA